MEENSSSTAVSPVALFGAISGIVVLIVSVIYLFFRSPSSSSKIEETKIDDRSTSENNAKKQSAKSTNVKPTKSTVTKFTHPWLCASLRAHSSSINGLNFSHNDKYLASAAEGNFIIIAVVFHRKCFDLDDSVLLWQTRDFDGKDHK